MEQESTAPEYQAAAELAELMFPATMRGIAVVAEYGIADLLASGPRPVTELAAEAGADGDALGRLLRLLAEDGIFAEVETGVFANTPMSRCLRSKAPGSLRSMARMTGEPWMWACWGGLDVSVKTGAPAFEAAYQTNLWQWLRGNPESAQLFNEAMAEFSETFGAQLARAYPEFGKARVIADLGGGLGSYLASILDGYPAVELGVLVDLPPVVEQARKRHELAAFTAAGRFGFAPGDFFESVPENVDIYVTKQIMHSWGDDQLAQVLRRCREASPGARIVAAELVNHSAAPRFVRNFDLMMLVTMSGNVRTEEQYADVYAQAGYRLTSIIPTGTPFALIEAIPS
jgi:hypothetical protein